MNTQEAPRTDRGIKQRKPSLLDVVLHTEARGMSRSQRVAAKLEMFVRDPDMNSILGVDLLGNILEEQQRLGVINREQAGRIALASVVERTIPPDPSA